MLIVIDPGHGGRDPGAVGPAGVRESDINLQVALRLEQLLIHRGHKIILTRREDDYISLTERAAIANKAGADCFISLHCNAATSRQAHGFEVWTSPGKTRADPLATQIAAAWAKEFPEITIRADWSDGDVDKEARFYVLMNTVAPAALLEMQSISHPKWEQWLGAPLNQERISAAVADGVEAWGRELQIGGAP